MEIFFKTKRLQKICSNENEAIKKLGTRIAAKLWRRLADLKALYCLHEILNFRAARCHELSGNRGGQLSVDLVHPYRLLFIPANQPVPVKEDGGLDWAKVTEIEIVEITDTH